MARAPKIGRRQFLRGIGGVSLGLPFLPSLVPGLAWGQEVQAPAQKRFVAITTNHGGVTDEAMFPDPAILSEQVDLYPGHRIARGDLIAPVVANERVLSPVLRAPGQRFSVDLLARMNVLRGIDIPFYIAHHTGGHLGNYARNDGNGEEGQVIQSQYMPTIDQLMAWSDAFYRDLGQVSLRSVITGSNGRMSWNWSNPSTRSGAVVAVEHRNDYYSLFEDVFKPADETREEFARALVVDRVLESYHNLRYANRRISALDAQRLDDHMDRMFELQRRLHATQQNTALCHNFELAEGIVWNDYRAVADAYVDVVEAALLCGSSSIAVIGLHEEYFAADSTDWHQSIAHRFNLEGPQAQLQYVNQQVFERVFIELANRLNVEETPGQTVLDNTLMVWSQECGQITHDATSIPIVTCGRAGGWMSTGNYCDYRKMTDAGRLTLWGEDMGHSGLIYNQWLATMLHAMGVPDSEWAPVANNGATGYGLDHINSLYAGTHAAGVRANASQPLPFLRA